MFLNCHTYYSLRYGTLSVDELVDCAIRNNVKALALTDINSTMGTVDFVQACNKKNIHPIAGIEFKNGNDFLYTGIALNNEGFRELNEFLTACSIDGGKIPERPPQFREAFVIYPFDKGITKKLLENEFVGIRPSDLNRFATMDRQNLRSKYIALYP